MATKLKIRLNFSWIIYIVIIWAIAHFVFKVI